MPRRKTTGLSSTLQEHESFYGRVETTDDALRIIEACSSGILNRAQRRLTSEECTLIRPGSVYVFDESESGIKRWTDGKVWSPSRILGNFLVYRELERKIGRRAGGGPNCSGLPKELRNSGLQIIGSTKGTFIVKGAGGLLKKTFSAKVGRSTTHLVIYLPNETKLAATLPSVSSYSELKDVPIRKEFMQAQKFRRPPPGSVRNRDASNRRKRKSGRRQELDSEDDDEEEDEEEEEGEEEEEIFESEDEEKYDDEDDEEDQEEMNETEDVIMKTEDAEDEQSEMKRNDLEKNMVAKEEDAVVDVYKKEASDAHQTCNNRKRTKTATDTESEGEDERWSDYDPENDQSSLEGELTEYEDRIINQTDTPTDNDEEKKDTDTITNDDADMVNWCRLHTPPFLPPPSPPATGPHSVILQENYKEDGEELFLPEVYDKEDEGYLLGETESSDCLFDDPSFCLEYFCNRSPNLSPYHHPDANSVASGMLDQVLKSSERNVNVDVEGCRKVEGATLTPPPSSPSEWSCGGDLFEYYYSPRCLLVKRE